MKKTKKVFRSRISVLLIIFTLAIFIPVSIPVFQYKEYQVFYYLGAILLFMALIFTGMRYVILDGKLYVKMWFIPNGSVNIADIISVQRSYNPLSSPAASLKRLHIKIVNNSFGWLISPVREKEFIEELKAVNPDIYVRVPVKKGMWRIWDWDL